MRAKNDDEIDNRSTIFAENEYPNHSSERQKAVKYSSPTRRRHDFTIASGRETGKTESGKTNNRGEDSKRVQGFDQHSLQIYCQSGVKFDQHFTYKYFIQTSFQQLFLRTCNICTKKL